MFLLYLLLFHSIKKKHLRFRFHECHGKGLTLSEGGRVAVRGRDLRQCIAFSATPLTQDELFEFTVLSLASQFSGTLSLGITTLLPSPSMGNLPQDCCYITGMLQKIYFLE